MKTINRNAFFTRRVKEQKPRSKNEILFHSAFSEELSLKYSNWLNSSVLVYLCNTFSKDTSMHEFPDPPNYSILYDISLSDMFMTLNALLKSGNYKDYRKYFLRILIELLYSEGNISACLSAIYEYRSMEYSEDFRLMKASGYLYELNVLKYTSLQNYFVIAHEYGHMNKERNSNLVRIIEVFIENVSSLYNKNKKLKHLNLDGKSIVEDLYADAVGFEFLMNLSNIDLIDMVNAVYLCIIYNDMLNYLKYCCKFTADMNYPVEKSFETLFRKELIKHLCQQISVDANNSNIIDRNSSFDIYHSLVFEHIANNNGILRSEINATTMKDFDNIINNVFFSDLI